MGKKAVVFCCKGLGDGLISLILSHNLRINGYEVITFHPFLDELKEWFPNLRIEKLPQDAEDLFHRVEKIFFFFEKMEPMQQLIHLALSRYPDKTTILNPIATTNCDYPFWSHGKFRGELSFVDNLVNFCKFELKLPIYERSNGIVPPFELVKNADKKRVVIHPTSSREGKNWPKEKFIQLASCLKAKGFYPYFLLQEREKKEWEEVKETIAPTSHLASMGAFLYQSGFFIGNDSGLGHLASCLGIPTVTIGRSATALQFWRPAFTLGAVVIPSSLIPNFKGLRLRDRFWKKWICVEKVMQAFDSLLTAKTSE